MPKTISEKILSNHCSKSVYAGDIAICNIDFAFAQDGTSPLAIRAFKKMGGKSVFDREKVAFVIDHSSPSPNEAISALHRLMRKFADLHEIKVYDIGSGVCHQVIPEGGHVFPGSLVIGADSHTCTYGAINAFSTGVGSTDLAAAFVSGKLWFKVPETIKIEIVGRLPYGVYAKDLILHIIGDLGANGANYKAVEFTGSVVEDLSVDARFTIANMVTEAGAKVGIFTVDDKTREWLRKYYRKPINPVLPDPDANYVDIKRYDVSSLQPQIASPHAVDNVCRVSDLSSVKINQAFLGTCTNGRLEDLRIGASILKGRRVHPQVRLIIAPASRLIYLEAIKEGILQVLVEAGGVVVTPGCGCCVGTHNGIPSDFERVISTSNRNFQGRMGNRRAFIYLASPATVAASSITGKITDPREFL
ncbi:MAG: 3-isopropylmalate dehydratase large subunit [bacterium]|nr:3-isopropylmalate dehydratase large subunit [bacterium]